MAQASLNASSRSARQSLQGRWPAASAVTSSRKNSSVYLPGVITVRWIPFQWVRQVTHASRAEGRTIYVGRQVATAEGRLVGPDGKLYAHATTTCLIFDLPARAAG